jgi:heat shock protein HtpX
MFYSLPAETVFEAKEKTRRATFYLFILLVALYIFFANLLVVSAFIFTRSWTPFWGNGPLFSIVLWTSLASGLLAVAHFIRVRLRPLDDLLDQIRARPADPKDQYHLQFINLVQEMEAATGLHGIRPVVLADPGANAFSLMDGQGNCAIGVTDGLLSKLNRQELSAVLAHEGAHLIHEDSRLVTTACFLFAVFGEINQVLGGAMTNNTYSYYERRSSRGGGISGLVLVLWLISGLGYLITKLVSMAISREREYLADADGVSMCKDPLGLAEALYKISHRYRGQVPESYSALFILNPGDSGLDDQEGFFSDLFSNHPPVSQRLSKLLNWAKSDLPTLEGIVDREEGRTQTPPKTAAPAPSYMAYQNNEWKGPFSPAQMLSMGFLSPSAWVCPVGTQTVQKASEISELMPLLAASVQGPAGPNACPRCKVPLQPAELDGSEVQQCSFCKGYLLRGGVLERLITREETTYSPEEIKKAKTWRDSQRGPLKDRDAFPEIKCPLCGDPMGKGIHSMLTQVVIDHCTNEKCGAIWCDGGELETIRMIIKDAHAVPTQVV